jgi:hypothetical protein
MRLRGVHLRLELPLSWVAGAREHQRRERDTQCPHQHSSSSIRRRLRNDDATTHGDAARPITSASILAAERSQKQMSCNADDPRAVSPRTHRLRLEELERTEFD